MDSLKTALGMNEKMRADHPVPDYATLLKREDDLRKAREGSLATKTKLACTPETGVKLHPSRTMLACEFKGAGKVQLMHRIARDITDPEDVIVRITTTTICGSDLHMYYDLIPAPGSMKEGDIIGHECMGVVEEVGPNVTKFKPGDRVVVGAAITCGQCEWCKNDQPTLCDHTNASGLMEQMYGHRLSGIIGYSHMCGGYSGGQAEYLRVPLADNNLLKIPDNLHDEQVLLLSDVCCTGWHANEFADVQKGDTVAVWGLGPIGTMACYLAKTLRGASRVIGIDCDEARLARAKSLGFETINFKEKDVFTELNHNLIPGGPNCCIEAAGFRFPKTTAHKVMTTLKLESDTADIPAEIIKCCRKGGRIAFIGDYFGLVNGFPMGAMMEKGLTIRGSQVYVQKYWHYLLSKIADGTIQPNFLFTHRMDLENVVEAYDLFANRKDNVEKILLVTKFGKTLPTSQPVASSGYMTKSHTHKLEEESKRPSAVEEKTAGDKRSASSIQATSSNTTAVTGI